VLYFFLLVAQALWTSPTDSTVYMSDSVSQLIQEAQLLLTNCATLFCKVVEVLQDFLSENVDKKFTTDYNVA